MPQILFLDTIGVNKKSARNSKMAFHAELKLRHLSILKCESILRCKCIFILNENWKAKNLFISSSNCLLVPEIGMSNWNGFNIAVCRIFTDKFRFRFNSDQATSFAIVCDNIVDQCITMQWFPIVCRSTPHPDHVWMRRKYKLLLRKWITTFEPLFYLQHKFNASKMVP